MAASDTPPLGHAWLVTGNIEKGNDGEQGCQRGYAARMRAIRLNRPVGALRGRVGRGKAREGLLEGGKAVGATRNALADFTKTKCGAFTPT
jgi:hypothetical protein